jgi:sulfur-carrier protein
MEINVIAFGQLTEQINSPLVFRDIPDTDVLIGILNEKFPSLAEKKYLVAVNKKTISGKTILNDKNIVALMPAFSGG